MVASDFLVINFQRASPNFNNNKIIMDNSANLFVGQKLYALQHTIHSCIIHVDTDTAYSNMNSLPWFVKRPV